MADTVSLVGDSGQLIEIPDFDFSGFYYPEIYASLQEYRRVNLPEITLEDDREPIVQLERAFSLVGHLNNTRLDVVANELLLESAQLRESVRRLFDLIGVDLKSATPATAELVMGLSTTTTQDIAIFIRQDSTFSTQPDLNGNVVEFETLTDLSLTRGDEIGYVFGQTLIAAGLDGSVDSLLPTVVTSASAPFSAADVGRSILISNSQNQNAGTYEITRFIDASNVEVSGASFITENTLVWAVTEFGTNLNAEANDGITSFQPTATIVDNAFYVGHDDLIWEELEITMQTPGAGFKGVWEYYDPLHSAVYPNSVTDLGGTIEVVIDSLVGAGVSRQGGVNVVVRYNPTGVSEQLLIVWDGSNNKVTTRGFLGQTAFDSNPLNYTVTSDWVPFENQVLTGSDASNDFISDGPLTYRVPKTRYQNWSKATINGVEAYFLRYRYVETTGAVTEPVFLQFQIDQARQFFPFSITQGTTIRNENLGSSNGLANQEFTFLRGPLFDDSELIEIDESGAGNFVPWTKVSSFLRSRATDRHYTLRADEEGIATVRFGNGIKGRIPPTGTDNIRATEYRVGGELNGNVGYGEINEDQTGTPFASFVENPMPASGWRDKEGGTAEDLERVKDEGPASIRASKAVATSDMARLAINEFVDDNGSALVARAFAIEEAYGPKTVQLIVVGSGGGFLTTEELAALDTFFNGDQFSIPPVEGIIITGQELTSTNYIPRQIDAIYTITGTGLTVNGLKNAITAHLNPLLKDASGNYVHKFGGLLSVTIMDCAVKDAGVAQGGSISNIVRTSPASDVNLAPLELPVPGTISVSIVEG